MLVDAGAIRFLCRGLSLIATDMNFALRPRLAGSSPQAATPSAAMDAFFNRSKLLTTNALILGDSTKAVACRSIRVAARLRRHRGTPQRPGDGRSGRQLD